MKVTHCYGKFSQNIQQVNIIKWFIFVSSGPTAPPTVTLYKCHRIWCNTATNEFNQEMKVSKIFAKMSNFWHLISLKTLAHKYRRAHDTSTENDVVLRWTLAPQVHFLNFGGATAADNSFDWFYGCFSLHLFDFKLWLIKMKLNWFPVENFYKIHNSK